MRYLVLTYVKKPDGKINEQMEVTRNIKRRDLQMGNVILDFKELKVVKCSMDGVNVPPDWNRILEYYYQHYESTIERLLRENGYEIVKEEPKEEVKDEEPNNPN